MCLFEMENSRHKNTPSQAMIREIIQISNLSLKKISAKSRVSLPVLSRLLSGKVENPRANIFEKILAFYCYVCFALQDKAFGRERLGAVIYVSNCSYDFCFCCRR